ncbi:YjfK family protein [Limobrevibacterium gyesilva]|uniref:YjfK family protein n=1 Tax=Limobrevibacterium gyesilva TaxID=2991712 RepID=A0AA42CEV4_9PROT|nr:YjfK family protein [Limobrevibacterium gyesilva]MCW3474031.1 YjfK family protein [Limobrevibacterium gyesilva]
MFRPLPSLLLALVLACAPGLDTASARAPSSGGYSRPSSSPSYAAPSARGSSGGYAAPTRRPSTGYSSAPSSGGDAAISRQSSGQALRSYRAGQAPSPAAPQAGYGGTQDRRPSTYGYNGSGGPGGGYGGYAQPRSWAPVYAPPAYGWAQQGRSFGVWDGLMLWSLLNSLSAPGHADFFYNNQNSPAYQQWRAEAQRAASTDPAVQARLAELDQRLAQMQGQPRQPGAPPPPAARSGSGGITPIIVVLLLGATFATLWYWRRQASATAAIPPVPAALAGSTLTRFRVGMTIPVDPTPFVLAAGATKIRPLDGGGMISVEAVGVLMDGTIPLNRLYLPGRDAFFQLHLGADGKPDECRYFSRIDQVTPASQEEWGAWLDPAQGMIGWPQFQTKDGKLYDRAWVPGGGRIEPRALKETIQDLKGTSSRELDSMLYMGPTGVASPAPAREYILVSAVDEGGQAWVDIHAGIDINPAALTLPSVALS